MNFFRTYEKRIIKQDLINKFPFRNGEKLPQLKKITLNFGCKSLPTQKFAAIMLALELIALKKGTVTTAKKPNILLKIQKGQPAGCKVELRNEEICQFITKLSLEILPKLKHFAGFKLERQFSNFFFQIPGNKLMLKEFENQYPLFANLPALDVNISTDSKNHKKNLFLAKALKLPVL
jgi:ribosomal protein L5